ncbi:migration and invasion enhancer 1-like isoform X1 [Branchiostoma floridae x Branchiostoma belcheri]
MGVVGRSSSFEITVDGQLLFSKLDSGGFPEEKEVLQAITGLKEVPPVRAQTTDATRVFQGLRTVLSRFLKR